MKSHRNINIEVSLSNRRHALQLQNGTKKTTHCVAKQCELFLQFLYPYTLAKLGCEQNRSKIIDESGCDPSQAAWNQNWAPKSIAPIHVANLNYVQVDTLLVETVSFNDG